MEQHKKGADVLTLGLLRHDVSEVHLKLKGWILELRERQNPFLPGILA